MYFFVFLTYVFYCFCCFISFPTTIQLFWPQNKHLNFKQDQITNVLSLYLKNEISICFVHKSQKWAIFGLTCKDKRKHDFVIVGPIFEKFLSKDAQDSKEKSHKISVQDFFCVKKLSRKMSRGGGASKAPPPPPPGLNRVKENVKKETAIHFHLWYWRPVNMRL